MGDAAKDVAAFILAGGHSSRMGEDKAFVMWDGRTLLARALELARSVTDDVRVVGDAAKFGTFAPVVEDVFRGCGPLGGIHAALGASDAELNLMLAVDMPLVTLQLLRYLIERARSSDTSVTVARCGDGWQPLCAVYRRSFADVAESALREGRYKIDRLFSSESTRAIEEKELTEAGFSEGMFRNLNTPEQLAEARRHG